MTKLLDDAVAAVRRLPAERQDEIAAAMVGLADQDGMPETIDPDHLAAIDQGLAEIERGDFASDDEVAAAFRCFGA